MTSGSLSAARTKFLLRDLLRRLQLLRAVLGLPGTWVLHVVKNLIPRLLANPHIKDILRFVFLGSLVELTRSATEKAADLVKHFFIVKASFSRGDFAFDWVKRYLEDHRIWDQSRIFHVAACNPELRHGKSAGLGVQSGHAQGLDDGHPHPVYQPAPQTPELFQWRGHWITVSMQVGSSSTTTTGSTEDDIKSFTLSVWSRNRKILDEFVLDARERYIKSALPPRELITVPDRSGSLFTAHFNHGDSSYDWIVAFLRSQDSDGNVRDVEITTKRADLRTTTADSTEKPHFRFKPASNVKQRLNWRGHWIQFDFSPFSPLRSGGSFTVTIHNSKRSVLEELIQTAREEYMKTAVWQVTVHLPAPSGTWGERVTKKPRAMNSLILPEGVKEQLLNDIREFLECEEWYAWAGIPHRRGYLLYGKPGTGKSSTIHAVASELELEIYHVQLSSNGMDDRKLAMLVSASPPRCILLLEDIDCAFPSREDEEDEEDQPKDSYGNPFNTMGLAQRSLVTLSGLLNVLDGVSSEEGRILFATTNHIERLDPALIRAGRMDVKLEYTLATRSQIHEGYLHFFERRFTSSDAFPLHETRPSGPAPSNMGFQLVDLKEEPLSEGEVYSLAQGFTDAIPEDTFSLAEIQGYLLTRKMQPRGAVEGAAEWVESQIEERRKVEELKEERKRKRKERKEKKEKGEVDEEQRDKELKKQIAARRARMQHIRASSALPPPPIANISYPTCL